MLGWLSEHVQYRIDFFFAEAVGPSGSELW
jgi:hypothetical protein